MSTFSRRRSDDGMTIIEVIVAIAILGLVMVAIVAQVIAGTRAAATSRDVAQAKGISQGRLEQMRAMPFFVGRSAGDYIDVLDTFYRNTTAPATAATCTAGTALAMPQTSWTGYLPATTPRCAYEPTGPTYRKVYNPISAPGLGAFAMVVNTQFLTQATPPVPVTPQTGYNTQVAGADTPASNQIGVTVTVIFRTQSGYRSATTYTQISQRNPIDPLIESRATVNTLRVTGNVNSAPMVQARMDLGVLNLAGELSAGASATAAANPASVSTSLGQAAQGATRTASAPGDDPAQSDVGNPGGLFGDCSVACFGYNAYRNVSAFASDGLPLAGTPSAPVQAHLPTTYGLRFYEYRTPITGTRLRLSTTRPMVSLSTDNASSETTTVTNCAFSGGTDKNYLSATGFLTATKDTGSDYVRACATAQSNLIEVMPTDYAPDGIVQIELDKALTDCRVNTTSGGHSPTRRAEYSARVRYWDSGSYVTVPTITHTRSDDPLRAVDLTRVVGPNGQRLGDYIASWRGLSPAEVDSTLTADSATTLIPGVISIDTQPLRENVSGGSGPYLQDLNSSLSVQVGALSCTAKDAR